MESCKLSCRRPGLYGIVFNSVDTTRDSSVIITKYDANSNFGQPRDSAFAMLEKLYHYQVEYYFEPGYHYKISVHPSGKTYTVKYIKIGTDYMFSSGGGSDECVSAYSYYFNDSLVYYPERTYTHDYVGVIEVNQ